MKKDIKIIDNFYTKNVANYADKAKAAILANQPIANLCHDFSIGSCALSEQMGKIYGV